MAARNAPATPDDDQDQVADQVPEQTSTAMVPATQWTVLAQLPRPEDNERPIHYLARIMEMLPQQTDDVVDRILDNILLAPTQMDENKLWDSTGSRDAIGKRFIVHSVHINPSDYADGPLPYYIIARVTDLESGEDTVLTSGSVNIVTSLVKAQLLGNLPWEMEIRGPRRVPKNGRVPLHVMWVGKIVGPA